MISGDEWKALLSPLQPRGRTNSPEKVYFRLQKADSSDIVLSKSGDQFLSFLPFKTSFQISGHDPRFPLKRFEISAWHRNDPFEGIESFGEIWNINFYKADFPGKIKEGRREECYFWGVFLLCVSNQQQVLYTVVLEWHRRSLTYKRLLSNRSKLRRTFLKLLATRFQNYNIWVFPMFTWLKFVCSATRPTYGRLQHPAVTQSWFNDDFALQNLPHGR